MVSFSHSLGITLQNLNKMSCHIQIYTHIEKLSMVCASSYRLPSPVINCCCKETLNPQKSSSKTWFMYKYNILKSRMRRVTYFVCCTSVSALVPQMWTRPGHSVPGPDLRIAGSRVYTRVSPMYGHDRAHNTRGIAWL